MSLRYRTRHSEYANRRPARRSSTRTHGKGLKMDGSGLSRLRTRIRLRQIERRLKNAAATWMPRRWERSAGLHFARSRWTIAGSAYDVSVVRPIRRADDEPHIGLRRGRT